MAPRHLVDAALKLSTVERGQLVRVLIESLDAEEHDEDPMEVERAWAAELEARATSAIRGETVGRDLDVVCDELDAKRSRKR